MKETQETCQLCLESGHLTKVPQMPFVKQEQFSKDPEAGSLTREYIEKNKELLGEMKKEARGNDYDI
jgi:hypothetical protein